MFPGHPHPAERSLLFLLGSTRDGGNTESLARHAANGLPPGTGQRWLRLSELPLPEYRDTRHDQAGQHDVRGWPAGNERLLLDSTLRATDLVIATPLYWYTVSASVKQYLDRWVWWMYTPRAQFESRMRDKTLWVITVLTEEPEQAGPMVDTLRQCAAYFGMRWGGALVGNGNRPGDVASDERALARAKTFFAAPSNDLSSYQASSLPANLDLNDEDGTGYP